MTEHKCITDLSTNFYRAIEDLSENEPIVVTNHGKPVMTILKGDHSVSAMAQQEQSTPDSYSYVTRSMSVYNSSGINQEDIQKTIATLQSLLNVSNLPQPEEEVKNDEKDHTHK